MPYILSGTYSTLVTLSAAVDNPTTITQYGLLTDGLSVSYPGLSLVNAGTIIGGNDGIFLASGGSVTNQSGGAISGAAYGIDGVFHGGAVTVVNAGSIAGSTDGIYLNAGGIITNQSGGTITGHDGIDGENTAVTVVNAGSITGSFGGILLFAAGGSVTNQSGGVISGNDGIVDTAGAVSVVNAGSIAANAGGVVLLAGGSVTNQSGGVISGALGIEGQGAGVTVVNAGSITGSNDAVQFYAGGRITNQSGGLISGDDGIVDTAGAVTVVNAGSIAGSGLGIYLHAGGSVTNQSGGVISGTTFGIVDTAGAMTVVNAGSIAASSGDGVALLAGGSVTNQSGGVISGTTFGVVDTAGAVTVVNGGSIAGSSGDGVALGAGGSVTNQSGGAISGTTFGIIGQGGAVTVVNAGSIAGDSDALKLAAGFANRLVIDPGAVFSGAVTGGNAIGGAQVSTLELASAGAAGTLSGLGTQFVDFAQVTVDAEAQWTLTGANTIVAGAALTDVGTLIDTGILTNAGTLSGALTLAAGGVFSNASTGTVTAAGGTAVYGATGWAATVVNTGVIADTDASGGDGIDLTSGGSVTNQSGGAISGYVGIYGTGGALTVVNAGTIAGTSYAVQFAAGYANRLIIDPNGVFSGTVTGGNTIGSAVVSTLEVASAGSAGTLSGLGTQFVDFAQVTVDAGAQWILTGANTIVAGETLTDAGTLTNAGILSSYSALTLAPGGELSNASTGTITASDGSAVYSAAGGAATVVNAGVIAGYGDGIVLDAGDGVTNQSGGVISGYYGIEGRGGPVTVVNAGSIAASGLGVALFAGGDVSNQSGGVISGVGDGIYAKGSGATVVNAGSIGYAEGLFGVVLRAGGSVTNQSGGTITGGFVGIAGYGATVTVVNAGTIIGTNDAVLFGAGFANRLVIDPDAVFSGTVTGGNTIGAAYVSTLELASVGSAGTLSGLGTQFVDFAQVTVDAGAQWTLTGANTLASGDTITNAGTLTLSDGTLSGAAALINNGAIVLDPSNMTIASLTGSGSVTIEAGSTLDVTGVIASTETIVFAGPGASLLLGTPDSVAGSVTGFAAGDTIDLAGITPASVSDAGGELSFTGGSFPLAATIPLVIEPGGNGGTDIVPCFAEGTRIATPDGPVTVEALQAGDLVLTASGGVRPVRWIGFRTIDPTRHPAPDQVQPIRIAAGAFAEGVPSRDLRLSPDHAVLLHGLLIPIKLLRNDASITRETGCRSVTYYHVELDAHDILLAEGLDAESYLDTGNRAMFENAGRPVLLHPDLTNEQARREGESCAPFADQPAVVEPIWRTLAARAEQMGLAVPLMPEATDDPALHLMVDGRRCDALSGTHGCYTFLLAGNASEVRLVSRHAVRPDTAPWVADRRRLGVQLGAMTIRCGGAVVPVPLDHPLLADGWWAPEWHAATTLRRWTKGDAVVPLMDAGPGPLLLAVELAATVPYPLSSAARKTAARRVISMAI